MSWSLVYARVVLVDYFKICSMVDKLIIIVDDEMRATSTKPNIIFILKFMSSHIQQ